MTSEHGTTIQNFFYYKEKTSKGSHEVSGRGFLNRENILSYNEKLYCGTDCHRFSGPTLQIKFKKQLD